jgi:Na+-driven multidrug efflux pump
MLFAVLVNAILDPLLIFGLGPFPRMELAGAAAATVTARASAMLISLYVLIHREKMVSFIRPSLKRIGRSWQSILYIGLPAGATNVIIPVGMGILTRMLSSYGPEIVAAFGIGSRIDMFALTVVMALATALGPFVGQNLGAGECRRIRRGIALSHRFSLIWGLFMTALLIFLGRIIAGQFNADPVVIRSVQIYLLIVPIGYGMLGVFILSTRSMNVLHRPFQAAGMNVLRMFGLFVPLAIIGNAIWGFQGIFLASPFGNLLAGFAACFWLNKFLGEDALKQNPS